MPVLRNSRAEQKSDVWVTLSRSPVRSGYDSVGTVDDAHRESVGADERLQPVHDRSRQQDIGVNVILRALDEEAPHVAQVSMDRFMIQPQRRHADALSQTCQPAIVGTPMATVPAPGAGSTTQTMETVLQSVAIVDGHGGYSRHKRPGSAPHA
jgi:hypothetical protein